METTAIFFLLGEFSEVLTEPSLPPPLSPLRLVNQSITQKGKTTC